MSRTGAVSGPKGCLVMIQDALKKPWIEPPRVVRPQVVEATVIEAEPAKIRCINLVLLHWSIRRSITLHNLAIPHLAIWMLRIPRSSQHGNPDLRSFVLIPHAT